VLTAWLGHTLPLLRRATVLAFGALNRVLDGWKVGRAEDLPLFVAMKEQYLDLTLVSTDRKLGDWSKGLAVK